MWEELERLSWRPKKAPEGNKTTAFLPLEKTQNKVTLYMGWRCLLPLTFGSLSCHVDTSQREVLTAEPGTSLLFQFHNNNNRDHWNTIQRNWNPCAVLMGMQAAKGCVFILFSARSQTQKVTYCKSPESWNFQNWQIHRKWVSGCQGTGRGESWNWLLIGMRPLFGVMEVFWKQGA